MLPKKLRMDKTSAKEVFMRPESTLSSLHLLLKTMKNTANLSQFSVSISKKVANTAVLRNRTRRRIYSVLRDLVPQVKQGFLVGFAVKAGGEKLDSPTLSREVQDLLKRARLFAAE